VPDSAHQHALADDARVVVGQEFESNRPVVEIERVARVKEKERWPLMFDELSTTPVHHDNPRPLLGRPAVMFGEGPLRLQQARRHEIVGGKNQDKFCACNGEGVDVGHAPQRLWRLGFLTKLPGIGFSGGFAT
jgi:hypothetical protein